MFNKFIFIVLFLTGIQLLAQDNSNNNKENNSMDNINGITVLDMNKKEVNLSDYNGKVLLIVNVASECGNTPQYAGLEEIYEKYHPKGFEILAFPCNDFGGQEPGTNEQIKNFCSSKYNVTFKLFDKIKVLGKDKSPLYERLINNSVTEKGDVKWNFEKFLISKDGKIVARFGNKVQPTSDEVISAIEKELKN
ncbi:MAG: glutathione peroxidase [Chlorobium sp.]|nr:glutathione peroxidase [Chlorobium sp.]MCW8960643.1 glutathione peroxidase [Ignavibacteriaceae bacterium]MCW9094274.1 glutathione peroxidase [Ignavibacteriaceae bacterium]